MSDTNAKFHVPECTRTGCAHNIEDKHCWLHGQFICMWTTRLKSFALSGNQCDVRHQINKYKVKKYLKGDR
jgi:hypothetical protein